MRRFITIFSVVHIAVIILVSINFSIDGYCRFYSKAKPKGYAYVQRLIGNPWMEVYTKYTGAESGYGYFAPNVLSSGTFVFRYGNNIYYPALSNRENMIRYQNLASAFISHTVEDRSLHTPAERKADSVKNRYFDLILKNMSVRFMQQHKFQDTLHAKLLLYEFPSLRQYDPRNSHSQFFPLLERDYFTKTP